MICVSYGFIDVPILYAVLMAAPHPFPSFLIFISHHKHTYTHSHADSVHGASSGVGRASSGMVEEPSLPGAPEQRSEISQRSSERSASQQRHQSFHNLQTSGRNIYTIVFLLLKYKSG